MAESKEEKTNKNKKTDTKAIVKPKITAGTRTLTNRMPTTPAYVKETIEKTKKKK